MDAHESGRNGRTENGCLTCVAMALLFLIGLLVIEVTGITVAVIGLNRFNDRLFLFGIFIIQLPSYISLIYF